MPCQKTCGLLEARPRAFQLSIGLKIAALVPRPMGCSLRITMRLQVISASFRYVAGQVRRICTAVQHFMNTATL